MRERREVATFTFVSVRVTFPRVTSYEGFEYRAGNALRFLRSKLLVPVKVLAFSAVAIYSHSLSTTRFTRYTSPAIHQVSALLSRQETRDNEREGKRCYVSRIATITGASRERERGLMMISEREEERESLLGRSLVSLPAKWSADYSLFFSPLSVFPSLSPSIDWMFEDERV